MLEVLNPYNTTYNITSQRYRYYLKGLLFLFWPFGAFLYSFYEFEKWESKVIIILFTGLFGYSLVAEHYGLDLYRVMQSLPSTYKLNFNEFKESRIMHGSVDLYRDMVTFVVSRFTNNPKWLMSVFGIFAGFVYVKVLKLFTINQSGKIFHTYLLIFSFSCIVSIDQLGGVRMSLASHVFFLSAIKVILFDDKRYLIIAASSILIHFSFLAVVLLLFIFPLFKKYPKAIYSMLILSFILPDLFKTYVFQYSGLFGQAIEARTEMYYNLTSDLIYGADTSWYIRYRINSMLIFCYVVFFLISIKRKQLNYSVKLNDLFLFSLLILSFVNFTMNIPHFGYRFQYLFLLFAFFFLFKVFLENFSSVLISNLVVFSLPFSLLMIFYSIRSTLSITPLSFYYFSLPGLFIDKSIHSAWTSLF